MRSSIPALMYWEGCPGLTPAGIQRVVTMGTAVTDMRRYEKNRSLQGVEQVHNIYINISITY
ncbi:MAG: hypothetical protein GF350_13075 [Chitinivibrionales bacterium]|nr:hypothetical protein [Chitinivibrionales bacterium]